MADRRWVLLAYRIPREPSTPRISVWRRLRQLGAVQVGDGLSALPFDERTREHFELLAEFIEEADGQASVWVAEAATAAQHRHLAAQMKAAAIADYQVLIAAAQAARRADTIKRRRSATRLRRALDRLKARDYFPPAERRKAERAVRELTSLIEAETI